MATPIVELKLTTPIDPSIAEQYRRLIASAFAASPGVERVHVTELPGGHAGLSSIAILLATPLGERDHPQNPLLIRIGPHARMDEETRRYKAYVEPYLGQNRSRAHSSAIVAELGIVTYEYIRDLSKDADDIPLQTLYTHLMADLGATSTASMAVARLFRETITQHKRNTTWYGGQAQPGQKALWFYNTIMPPVLELDEVRLVDQEPQLDLVELIAQADLPGSEALIGRRAVIAPARPFPCIKIVEHARHAEQHRLRLFCYETPPAGEQVFQPFPQVAARIDLLVSPELAQTLLAQTALPADLGLAIEGRIRATRHHGLTDTFRRRLGRVAAAYPDGRIRLRDGQVLNPFDEYHRLLSAPRLLTSSIVHGDMNLGNILLSVSEQQGVVSPWLIDFDKTGPGQHAVFDAVKLETEYKTQVLPRRLRSGHDLLTLESALFQALNDPDASLDLLKGYPNLVNAYHFLATVRRLALVDLPTQLSPAEYYLGLLGYGLAALKYENLYLGAQRDTEPNSLDASINPAALAAYLSAAYAATKLAEVEHLNHTPERWYPPLPANALKLRRLPHLVGRDVVLAQADQLLADPPQIVMLHGAPHSGRGAVAMQLLAELEGEGYTIWPWPIARQELPRIEDLTHRLARDFSSGEPPPRPTGGPIGQWGRSDFIDRTVGWLHALLERSNTARPAQLALLLDLDLADDELRELVAALCTTLEQTRLEQVALLIVVDHPLSQLEQRAVQIKPFGQQEVRAFLDIRQVVLDDVAIAALTEACLGMPGMLKLFFDQARALLRTNDKLTLQAALQQVSQGDQGGFFASALQKLPAPLVALLAFEQFLRDEQHTDVADDKERDQLLGAIAEAAEGWSSSTSKDRPTEGAEPWRAGQGAQLVRMYRAYAHQTHPTALKQLCIQARATFSAAFARDCCQLLADYYSAPQHRKPFYEAHYLVKRRELREQETGSPPMWAAESVERLGAALLSLASEPGSIYSARCARIQTMVRKALDENPYLDGAERLYALSGDCKAYIGRFDDASAAYRKALTLTPEDDALYPQLLARLLRTYQELDDDRAEQIAAHLHIHTDAGNQLQTLWHMYRSQVDDDHALEHLGTAIALLEASRAQWGSDAPVLAEQLVRLQDERAVAIHLAGDSAEAIKIAQRLIQEVSRDPQLRRNSALIARLRNNLGCFLYYGRCLPGDPKDAEVLFDEALKMREQVGDVLGAIRAAQNLSNVRVSLGRTRDDWDAADLFFGKYIARAGEVQAANRLLIVVNYLDALIARGAFAQAHELAQSLEHEQMDEYTRKALLLNRAKLWLWEGQPEACAADLAMAELLVAQADTAIDRIEWVQLALEHRLLFPGPSDQLNPQFAQWLAEAAVDSSKRALDAAEWHLAAGLLALAQGTFASAHDQLKESARLWTQLGFQYRSGLTSFWQAEALRRDGQQEAAARLEANKAREKLAPFGELPALVRLKRLEEHLAMEK